MPFILKQTCIPMWLMLHIHDWLLYFTWIQEFAQCRQLKNCIIDNKHTCRCMNARLMELATIHIYVRVCVRGLVKNVKWLGKLQKIYIKQKKLLYVWGQGWPQGVFLIKFWNRLLYIHMKAGKLKNLTKVGCYKSLTL